MPNSTIPTLNERVYTAADKDIHVKPIEDCNPEKQLELLQAARAYYIKLNKSTDELDVAIDKIRRENGDLVQTKIEALARARKKAIALEIADLENTRKELMEAKAPVDSILPIQKKINELKSKLKKA